MTPIEILATIFAILVLVKLLIIAIRPASWMKISEAILKKSTLTTISYFISGANDIIPTGIGFPIGRIIIIIDSINCLC